MTSLTDFLIARLADDEAVARAAAAVKYGPWEANRILAAEPGALVESHYARHDPARVLADVEAKRKIVERFAAEAKRHQTSTDELFFGETLRDLASIYADHPDYRAEWRL